MNSSRLLPFVWALLAPTSLAIPAAASPAHFTDATAEVGLEFRYQTGATGELYFPEIMGGGVALFDFDLDGDLDVFLPQAQALATGAPRVGDGDRLLRNDLRRNAQGVLYPTLVDVTPQGGLAPRGYSLGAAVGDYDRDGWPDLYISRFGEDVLLRNLGDGRFENRTAVLGGKSSGWSSSVSFADFDGDGWLDLYVTGYVYFSVAENPRCFATSTRRDYCGPSSFRGLADRLLRNRRDGTFEDVSSLAGLSISPQPGLGVIAGDFSADSKLDFYVANDGQANQLWLAQNHGAFADEALLAGVSVDREGLPQGSMGIDAGDFDRDGDEDLIVTHIAQETNALYVQDSPGQFSERSMEAGLGAPGLPFTGFGTVWLDADLDGWLDLFVANGAVRTLEDLQAARDPFPFGERNQLFLNRKGRFVEATPANEPALGPAEVSRGLAMGDLDNDGDADLLVVNAEGPARLLSGTASAVTSWLAAAAAPWGRALSQLELGSGRNRQIKRSHTDGSYLSASDSRLIFGLGEEAPANPRLRQPRPGAAPRQWLGLAPRTYFVLPPGADLP